MGEVTQESIAERLQTALTPSEATELEYCWRFWARPDQLAPPGEWFIWLILSGRGFGKTRMCAEFVRGKIESGQWSRVAIVNDTAADVRDVNIEGPDGLMAVAPPWFKPTYEPSKRRLTYPNGAVAICYAAEAPELLRGPQHDGAWADEACKWENLHKKDAQSGTAWDNLMFGLRMGKKPQCVVGTTPRPIKWLREIRAEPSTVITRGTFYDNIANLAPDYVAYMKRKYEGTRLGRQELGGEELNEVEGALWTRKMIDDARVDKAPELVRIVVAIDPAVTSGEDADETGIITAGRSVNGHFYVMRDLSGHFTPQTWAQRAVYLFHEYKADRIIGEANNGGDMIESVLRGIQRDIPYKKVIASRGKRVRAEPIAALYEQGRVHHVGRFDELEDQLCSFVPDLMDSADDRLDALVWGLTELEERRIWKPPVEPIRMPGVFSR